MRDGDWVRCATHMLRDDASLWWDGAAHMLNLDTLTWDQFKEAFYGKYFLADVRGRLMREFMSLHQGDSTIAEFIRKFDMGCHFAPLIARDAAQKLRHFMDGLRPTLCRDGTFRCFICNKEGYKVTYFPRNKGPTTGGAYVMHVMEAKAEPDSTLITKRIYISSVATHALLDSGATNSFIFETFVKRLGIILVALDSRFRVSIPFGDQMFTFPIVRVMELRLQSNAVQAYLIMIPLPEFDIILGVDWISSN
ncbi:uncharacterized protein LOC142541873 [Primulina tabacum]|uniref:uncharacterized protein LOC142541873 n=1 Tax=Primulina tabacum TaxID=48773 RepID=UPI003F5A992C